MAATTSQRPVRAGRNAADQAGRQRQEDHDRQVDRHRSASRRHDQEVEDQAAHARPAAGTRRRAAHRSGSSARTTVPARTRPTVPPTSTPCTNVLSTTVRPKRPAAAVGPHDRRRRTARRSTTCSRGTSARPRSRSRARSAQLRAGACRRRRRAAMPQMASRPPDAEARPLAAGSDGMRRRAKRESSNVGSRKCSSVSVTPGHAQRRPRSTASSGQRRHRRLHRPLALGDVVLGAREADVGVLRLAGGRVGVLAVGQVPALQLPAPPAPASPKNTRNTIRNA